MKKINKEITNVKERYLSSRLSKRSKTIGQARKVEQQVEKEEWNNMSNKKSKVASGTRGVEHHIERGVACRTKRVEQ